MKKATKGQLKRHNRQLLLRAVYTGLAENRAALALETDLTKPAVSSLIAELIEDGLLIEEGFGESTDSGGKRPRLLKFVPESRQVIGVSINTRYILGVLTNLDGQVIAEHYSDLLPHEDIFSPLIEVINGLIAQLDAPLLCIGVGISAVVDDDEGIVRYTPQVEWHNFPLAEKLSQHYDVPAYVSNSTDLAALAQFAFGNTGNAASLATVLIGESVGVGVVLGDFHSGSEIGYLMINGQQIQSFLGWSNVKKRALELGQQYNSPFLRSERLLYLYVRHAITHADPAALILQDELTDHLAHIFSWVIALLRPKHISLAGGMADMGPDFLSLTIEKTRERVIPDLIRATVFSLDTTHNLIAVGAAAKAMRRELGLV